MNTRALRWFLGLLAAATTASAASVQVQWYGQAFFTLTGASNTVVAIDPFDGAFLNYPIPQNVRADILLVTHEHRDHNNVGIIRGDPLILRSDRGVGKNERNGVQVRGIRAWHDDQEGKERGRDTIFTIEMDGLRFCHLGDLGQTKLTADQLARIGGVDVLFLPAGGHFTTEPSGLRAWIDQIRPRVVVPMHYKTAYTRDLPLAGVEEFLKLNPDLPVKKLGATEFTVSKATLPATTEIWVLTAP